MRHHALILGISAILTSCTDSAPPPSATPEVKFLTPTPANPVEIHERKVEPRKIIAEIVRYKPKVNYKKRTELTWQTVEPELEFERHDSVQTQANASALIRYKSGSSLDLQENTLIVIDENQISSHKKTEDRAYVDQGRVEGKTTGELWILTAAGLIKIKATEKSVPSSVFISATADKTVKVKLSEGSGAIFTKDAIGKISAQLLTERIEIVATPPTQGTRVTPDPPTWSSYTPIVKSTSMKPEELQKITLIEPNDQAVFSAHEINVRGRLNKAGGKVLVNGRSLTIDSENEFKTQVALRPGANIVLIQLIRTDGTTEFKRVTVIQKNDTLLDDGK